MRPGAKYGLLTRVPRDLTLTRSEKDLMQANQKAIDVGQFWTKTMWFYNGPTMTLPERTVIYIILFIQCYISSKILLIRFMHCTVIFSIYCYFIVNVVFRRLPETKKKILFFLNIGVRVPGIRGRATRAISNTTFGRGTYVCFESFHKSMMSDESVYRLPCAWATSWTERAV